MYRKSLCPDLRDEHRRLLIRKFAAAEYENEDRLGVVQAFQTHSRHREDAPAQIPGPSPGASGKRVRQRFHLSDKATEQGKRVTAAPNSVRERQDRSVRRRFVRFSFLTIFQKKPGKESSGFWTNYLAKRLTSQIAEVEKSLVATASARGDGRIATVFRQGLKQPSMEQTSRDTQGLMNLNLLIFHN